MPAVAYGVPVITVGNWTLDYNTAGQTVDFVTKAPIQLQATGADAVNGMNLRNLINGGVAMAPFITAMDISSAATLFTGGFNGINAAPDGVAGGGSSGLTTAASMLVFSAVAANARPFAIYTFDTTGVAPGVYTWQLDNHPLGTPTTFTSLAGAIPTTLINGTITVVPEPGTVVLGLFAVAGLFAVVARKRLNGKA
jgi:hypothetical protein